MAAALTRARYARLPSPWTEAVDFLDLEARASKKVEHWRAWLCGKQRKSTASGQGEGSEMDTETQSEKITNSENDSLLAEGYLRGNNTSGSPARNYDPSALIGSAEKFDHVRAQVGSRKSLLEALHDS